MSQNRLTLFGDLIETADMPTVISNVFSPGRLVGCEFQVLGADLLGILAGSALLPDGVLIVEDSERELVIPNSSAPATYTIIYQLEDSRVIGGSPATLRLVSGMQRQSVYTDAVVLGWIQYPGGSVPLSDTFFTQPSPLKIYEDPRQLSFVATTPFPTAIRPATEMSGSISSIRIPISHITQPAVQTVTLPAPTTRLISATITPATFGVLKAGNMNPPQDLGSFCSYEVKSGSTTLFSVSTDSVALTAGSPSTMAKPAIPLPTSAYIIPETQVINLNATRMGSPAYKLIGAVSTDSFGSIFTVSTVDTPYTFSPNDIMKTMVFRSTGSNLNLVVLITDYVSPTSVRIAGQGRAVVDAGSMQVELQNTGEVVLTVETPATSGNWAEEPITISGEQCLRWKNITVQPATYVFQVPFVVSSGEPPKKLISRLNVDYECIVTHRIKVGTATIIPSQQGQISSTGTLITKEFDIPLSTSATWTAGQTAIIEVEIVAQGGRSASIAYLALTQEPSPFLLFA